MSTFITRDLRALEARVKRLQELYRGFQRERDNAKAGDLPLYIPERRAYLEALDAASAAVEAARKVLAAAETRIWDGEKKRRG
jgi:hypothetical protein